MTATVATEYPPNDFRTVGEDRYELHVPYIDTTLTVDRLRRERHTLIGELCVHSALPGASTVDGVLSIAEFNLSSQRAREDRGRSLARRARTNGEVDWAQIVEELCQRVLAAERRGTPAVDLRTVPRPAPDDVLDVEGLVLPRRHPAILFGDGGSAKSYLAVYYLGRLAQLGLRVGLFDWELASEDHRDRLERIFGERMPVISYARCERPLVSEADRLRRIVRDERLDYVAYDSVAFASDGPPEAAEVASRYFRATRAIGVGSLHIAHVTKSESGDQKPFGSAFWANGARSTWFARLAETTPDGSRIQLGLYNRKSNLGAIRSAVGFELAFSDNETLFSRVDLADVPDLAAKLSIRQRIALSLKRGAMSPDALAKDVDADLESVKRTVRRYRSQFVVLPGGYVGLAERDT